MKKIAEADFPLRSGMYRIHAFVDDDGSEHIALVRCAHERHQEVPVRIHSKCLTGDTFGSLRCDCRQQLEAALEYLSGEECGIFIYLDQEGRGIGLANKIRAYELQDRGRDTVEANLELGFADDLRDYGPAADILRSLGIKKVKLITNNPGKVKDLEKHGIGVVERIPLVVEPTEYNERYLQTKKEKMNHQL
ncbi:GTP cyclohydrolase II [Candidatus Micrarchaeota archaeon]|nr:GTP cyclohydrolase II [Candidatus Micrarchaeota archaeon]